jgi:hypothetical protein
MRDQVLGQAVSTVEDVLLSRLDGGEAVISEGIEILGASAA